MKYRNKWRCTPIPLRRSQLADLLTAFGQVTKRLHRDFHLPSPDMPWLPLDHFSWKIAYDPDTELVTAYLPARYSAAKTADELSSWGILIDVDDLEAADSGSRDVLEDRDLFESDLPEELQPLKPLLAWTTAYNFVLTD